MTDEKKAREAWKHPLEMDDDALARLEQEGEEASAPRTAYMVLVEGRAPYVTYGLLAINVLIGVLTFVVGGEIARTIYLSGALAPMAVLGDFQLHRLLTAMFLHGDWVHLLFNMLALYAIGRRIEQLYGHYRFLLVYLLGGLAGSVLSAVIGDYGTWSVGASGAVFAIWAGSFWLNYRHRDVFGRSVRLIMFMDLFYLAANILIGLDPTRNVDNWGHIGGFLGGMALVYALAPRYTPLPARQMKGREVVPLRDSNRFGQQHLPHLYAYAVGLGALLVLGMVIFRLQAV